MNLSEQSSGRQYRATSERDYAPVWLSLESLNGQTDSLVPIELIPPTELRRIAPPLYGMKAWSDLFSARQKVGLTAVARLIGKTQMPDVIRQVLALVVDRIASRLTSVCLWRYDADQEKVEHVFGRQAIPFVSDFAEAVPISESTGSFQDAVEVVAQSLQEIGAFLAKHGQVEQADAADSPLSDRSVGIWFTDPPYYDSVPYAHLADFFYIWLKRVVPRELARWFSAELTNKEAECVVDRPHSLSKSTKTSAYYESKMAAAMCEGRRVLHSDGIGCVVFAHKTTEGWETLLSGMLKAGFVFTASWPITTEMATRMVARDTAALAGSVHLVCRPRPADAGVGDWSEVKAAMEGRIREWLPTLVKHGVRGADAIFSCLGPALESYSRYDKVLTAADREVPLGGDPDAVEPDQRGFLAYVFETLSKEALRQVLRDAETEGFEEDARLTALFLWTLQATKGKDEGRKLKAEVEEAEEGEEQNPKKAKPGFAMPFDTFIRITRPMGIHYPALEGRVLEIEKGVVRLLSAKERTEELLGEALERRGIEISLDDFRQLELGLMQKPRTNTNGHESKKTRKRKPADSDSSSLVSIRGLTTLDRIHRAMLLFGLGRSTLLRQVLETEMRQGKRFERLALSLNALYPDGSNERRMLEGVQAAMRGIK